MVNTGMKPLLHGSMMIGGAIRPRKKYGLYGRNSRQAQGTGAAEWFYLFAQQSDGTSVTCVRQCPHFAELQAIFLGFQWVYAILSYCAAMGLATPSVTLAFGATSAGDKEFGYYWGGQACGGEVGNLRRDRKSVV